MDSTGKPVSFLEVTPEEFVRAWSESIDRAAEGSALGGVMVSEHFCRLAAHRLSAGQDTPQDTARLQSFLKIERTRQAKLTPATNLPPEKSGALVDTLQFCDLLSLYLCCGAYVPAEFPQEFGGAKVRITLAAENSGFLLDPSPFQDSAASTPAARRTFSLGAKRFPVGESGEQHAMLTFDLA
jgi:hypothetical protein